MLRSAAEGTSDLVVSQFFSVITTPFSKIGTNITEGISNSYNNIFNSDEIAKENEELKAELAELNDKLVEFERYKSENVQLREFLEIKEENPDFNLMPAKVIGRNAEENFYGFTIDKGTRQGVKLGDPVISGLGVVGLVSQVSYSSAQVTTILNASMQTGVVESATNEIGIITGTVELASDGKCMLTYLPRESAASVVDIIITSGVGGVFPKDLVMGEITAIYTESHGLSLYAEVTPFQDIRQVTDVSVITNFDGQREYSEELTLDEE